MGEGDELEQWSLTGGRQSSLAISVFLIAPACSRVMPKGNRNNNQIAAERQREPAAGTKWRGSFLRDGPLTRSVMYELEAIAEPQPKVLNLTSLMIPSASTLIWSFITVPRGALNLVEGGGTGESGG